MPRNKDIKKVLVIGSGPIVIGQAAEFDYAGTQACRSLKEEGLEVVLLNSNPATIMTDKDIADRVYIEPLTVEVVEQLILKEKPDSVLPTLGGQAGLNLAMELEEAGFLKEHNVRLIGTTAETIKKAEDRLEFKDTMEKIGEPVAASLVVENIEDGVAFADKIGYPVVLRPAYTLGGSGGGIAHDQEQLEEILENGLRLSRVGQVLVERCIAGWKEIEYEVMRDSAGNCITVCNMENIDPVGVHTGDSIVVAPSQTLGDKEYQMLRTSALNIITELNITGGCNVQYALHPDSFEYCVIEVNPRVSRSSALASKATGYPIAKVAAKIALGYTLDEIKNAVTKKTYASFEPMLDYCVVKMPRLPFDKFISAKRTLTTQMKATGEVMSICDNFEGALMKAIRSLEQHVDCLLSYDFSALSKEEILAKGLATPEEYETLERYTLALFERGTQMAAERGLILVDTKYEFGKHNGEIYLMDEIHTPDSSRYFYSEGYQERFENGEPQKQLSKEFVREWLMANGFQGKEGQKVPEMTPAIVSSISDRYIELYEHITGETFVKADTDQLAERIEKNVTEYLG